MVKFKTGINNIHLEGTVSQNFDLGLSFYFRSNLNQKIMFLYYIKKQVKQVNIIF